MLDPPGGLSRLFAARGDQQGAGGTLVRRAEPAGGPRHVAGRQAVGGPLRVAVRLGVLPFHAVALRQGHFLAEGLGRGRRRDARVEANQIPLLFLVADLADIPVAFVVATQREDGARQRLVAVLVALGGADLVQDAPLV